MKNSFHNIGSADKVIRLTIGIIFILIALLLPLTLWRWIFGVLGAILVITSLIRYCPIYSIFKFTTLDNKNENREN
ncbi:MAG TPA: DUF2892 domain-containing protein [Firmicutes bacterium]|uniref:DUF2892 domain-containing protein n=1 Tax=candidate division TA06 bacterium TaxID=2250710 RepID=A0A660S9P1_UNCT6|nr:DUF2892 domain-containing protein [candidate division WOR-3 bacterium]RKX67362.1 MAG: DUF2892 domain-containing protein [candidate division TA06 bacterium]HFD04715.1 DUF2892 domain-containing protein [Bacillota bacterium]